jgi:methylamine dehydrogenase heavy chain
MEMGTNVQRSSIAAFALLAGLTAAAGPPLPAEPIPAVATLPAKSEHWLYAHDAAFYSLTSGKVFVVDVGAESRNVLGLIGAAQFPSFRQSAARGELYVAESFFARGTRGEQTDVLTVYDAASLELLGEVVLPGTKRMQVVPQKAALQVTRSGDFALVFNFTPASSVTVVDLGARQVLNEIALPGCMLTYPFGSSGFVTLCGDGSLLALVLDGEGRVVDEHRTEPFNDIDGDPMFMKVGWVGETAYFPTFDGWIQPVDLSGDEPRPLQRWRLETNLPNAPADAKPSGWQVISSDAAGRLYVLMRENARPGEHKSGGESVWVVDPVRREVTDLVALAAPSLSIEATRASEALLVATNVEMELDVYDPTGNRKLRTIGGWGSAMPLSLHAAR